MTANVQHRTNAYKAKHDAPHEAYAHEIRGIAYMLVVVVFISIAQVLFKSGVGKPLWPLWIAGGAGLYGLSLIFNLLAYKCGRMSILFAINALALVLVVIAGIMLFDEHFSALNAVGLACIVAGTITISSDAQSSAKKDSA